VGSVALPAETVKAVVVKSWAGCTGNGAIWRTLNRGWAAYGSIPISIRFADQALCGQSFTLAALEASGADVVILDNPSGGELQYTPDEVAALTTYANEGHEVIGTYLTFYWKGGDGTDNTALAPLFGLVADAGWKGGGVSSTLFDLRTEQHPALAKTLFRDLPDPYQSDGYHSVQKPGDKVWSANELAGARIVATNADTSGAITVYHADAYDAIYIGCMPEYTLDGPQDRQLLYNAIIYPQKG
jgi:hypothetical protein